MKLTEEEKQMLDEIVNIYRDYPNLSLEECIEKAKEVIQCVGQKNN